MINLLSQNTDSIPFILKRDVVASIDTIPANKFLSYEYLPLNSSKVLYNIDAMGSEATFYGVEGVMRPFIQQFGGIIFLVFVLLFIMGSVVFASSGLSHFAGIRSLFSFDNRSTKSDKKLVTTIDVLSKLFYAFQTYIIYSILFFVIAVGSSSQFYSSYDHLILYLQIIIVFALFFLAKYLLYGITGSLFSKTKANILIDTYLKVFFLTGVLSFVPIIVFIYVPETKIYVLLFLSTLFIVGRAAIILQSYLFFIKAHIGSSFYFVYLCGIEIMPYLLLYKAIVLIN